MNQGVRGAISVAADTKEAICAATVELLTEILQKNRITADDVAAAFFSATADLTAVYPAAAARTIGWEKVPMMCSQEMSVQGSLKRCIRVLLLVTKDIAPELVQHVYLGEAVVLRPDLVG